MNEEVVAEKKRNSPPRGAGGGKKMRRFTAAEKLKAIRLHLEEGFSMALVCQELNVSKSSLGEAKHGVLLADNARGDFHSGV